MLISKFHLCKSEWLDLVFAERNKEYGAYYLRQHYAGNIIKAMGITFLSIVSAFLIIGVLIRVKPVTERIIPMINMPYVVPPVPPKVQPQKAKPAAAKPSPPVTTTKYVPMVVTDKPVTEDPPKLVDIKGEVGQVNITVPGDGKVPDPDAAKGDPKGTGTAEPKVDNTIHYGADVMPEPFGGAAGWMKFLQKNLRYPGEALDKNMTGRVLVSFVVEKDGSLSSITVDRGAGFGMDEEALRVLKLAKAWKPGLQNGQPVRVKYTLPVNFSLNQ
ncbi:MAG: Gram-negative bacterial tonB protein [Mucilaginibacter sp.]|nr:Gram-negative bacterial tonB protein [Mucilaginibacter sp.]